MYDFANHEKISLRMADKDFPTIAWLICSWLGVIFVLTNSADAPNVCIIVQYISALNFAIDSPDEPYMRYALHKEREPAYPIYDLANSVYL